MDPRFDVYTDRAGNGRWRLRAANGEFLAQSEGYAGGKDAATRGARDAAQAVARAAGLPEAIAAAIALTVDVVDVDD